MPADIVSTNLLYIFIMNQPTKNLEIFLNTEQPTTCPKCGARTDFDYIVKQEKQMEIHNCLNESCSFIFIGEMQ